ncbi:hypothetical protein FOZ63_001375 [Perkinsus olseni]|uniref:Uncharacterized protein n=1 Tax=Perkinsus olseni TaxID=32597 RepID=A0A7J6U0V2_PEROL|nr:hypothetical protein FOZ63_001375 [Perkinsus olseni]
MPLDPEWLCLRYDIDTVEKQYEVALSFAPTDVTTAISAAQRAFEPRVDPTKGDKATRSSNDAWVPCTRALHLYVVLRMIDLGGSVGSPASVALGNLFPRGVPSHLKKYVGGMLAGGRRGDSAQDVTGDAMCKLGVEEPQESKI